MARNKKSKKEIRLITDYSVQNYRCGLKAGDQVRLRKDIRLRDRRGHFTGNRYRSGEVWTVLPGSIEEPNIVWFRQTNGERHTWDDDPVLFETFELIKTRGK
jgi:hypothetical protein